jgi:hypothetical protein
VVEVEEEEEEAEKEKKKKKWGKGTFLHCGNKNLHKHYGECYKSASKS